MILVVSGPSGCGKSTLIGRVRDELPDLQFSVSHTTREPRPSETDGVDYHFVSEKTFRGMVRAGRFVEWANVHGHLYGTSKAELRRRGRRGDVILDIDVQGARQVRRRIPDAVLIFIMPPLFEELRRRLLLRREDRLRDIERRLRDAAGEVRAYREFDYVVVNGDLETAAAELKSVIVAAGRRSGEMAASVRPVLQSFAAGRRAAPKKGQP
jgi:guanylate kinase